MHSLIISFLPTSPPFLHLPTPSSTSSPLPPHPHPFLHLPTPSTSSPPPHPLTWVWVLKLHYFYKHQGPKFNNCGQLGSLTLGWCHNMSCHTHTPALEQGGEERRGRGKVYQLLAVWEKNTNFSCLPHGALLSLCWCDINCVVCFVLRTNCLLIAASMVTIRCWGMAGWAVGWNALCPYHLRGSQYLRHSPFQAHPFGSGKPLL